MSHLLHRIFRPRELLSPLRKKYLVLPHVVMAIITGVSLLIEDPVRQIFLVTQVVNWINPTVWAIILLIAAVLGLYCLLTGSWKAYAVTNIIVLSVASAWTCALIALKFIYHVTVSYFGFSFWAFILVDCIVIATINNRVIRTNSKV